MAARAPALSLLIAALAVACGEAPAPETEPTPTGIPGWTVSEPPEYPSGRWYAANGADEEWAVSLANGRIATRLRSEGRDSSRQRALLPFELPPNERADAMTGLYGDVTVSEVEDGWLVGYDGGEWGGSLWWFSPDGTDRSLISDDVQVKQFLETGAALLAIQGLAHLGIREGGVIRLARDEEGRWTCSTFVDLEDAPYAATQEQDGSLIVVTSKKLVRVGLDGSLEVLLDERFWWGMYPNSVAIGPRGAIFVGMRGGVVQAWQRDGRWRVDWLTPASAKEGGD